MAVIYVIRPLGGTLILNTGPVIPPVTIYSSTVTWVTRDNKATWTTRDNNASWKTRG